MKRVLAAEDSFVACGFLQHCLESAGHSVVAVGDGQEAWDHLNSGTDKFDLIISDLDMPNMDGLELLRRVRADARMSDIPFVLMNADVAISDEDPTLLETICRGLGADFVTKPVDYDEFIAHFLGT